MNNHNFREKIPFKPRAQILIQLGDQLIKNEGIALLELIKNTYDADATKCRVELLNLDHKELGEIRIEDNGLGMDYETIKYVWMEPGNSHKRMEMLKGNRTPLGRLPIGEKGIGRFGIHKLGRNIEIVSRAVGEKEIYFNIDWNRFEENVYLSDLPIEIFERDPEHFKESTGTLIVIKDLINNWSRSKFRDAYRSMISLNSPFKSFDSFSLEIKTSHDEWVEGLISFKDIKEFALYKMEATIENSYIRKFVYDFLPYENLKVNSRKIIKEDIELRRFSDSRKKDYEKFSLENNGIGTIEMELYVFDRSSDILRFINDKKAFSNYLNENGGIRIFRDNMRVLDYGEKENDWLNLGIKRINNPTASLSNNIILGAIYLNRQTSNGLVEKANREGFIQNDSYDCFVKAIESVLIEFSLHRNIDKDKLRESYNKGKRNIDDYIMDISDSIDKLNIQNKQKSDLVKKLDRISQEFKYLKETYIRTSSTTTSYAIVIHEIEKIILELSYVSNMPNEIEKINKLTRRLLDLVNGYTDLLRNRKKTKIKVKDLIDNALFNVEFRLKAHEIRVISLYKESNDSVVCDTGMLVSSIMNIIDNSIWWTHVAQPKVKKICIAVLNDDENNRCEIIVADNGTGFVSDPIDLVRPFVTNKPGGLGIGLNIVNEIMNSQKGQLLFPDYFDLSPLIPEDFKFGAIVALSLPKNKGE